MYELAHRRRREAASGGRGRDRELGRVDPRLAEDRQRVAPARGGRLEVARLAELVVVALGLVGLGAAHDADPAGPAPDVQPDRPVEQGDGQHRQVLGLRPDAARHVERAEEDRESGDHLDRRERVLLTLGEAVGSRDLQHPVGRAQQEDRRHGEHGEQHQHGREGEDRLNGAGLHAHRVGRARDGEHGHELGEKNQDADLEAVAPARQVDRRAGTRGPLEKLHGKTSVRENWTNRNAHPPRRR